jgi:hypothetical protein
MLSIEVLSTRTGISWIFLHVYMSTTLLLLCLLSIEYTWKWFWLRQLRPSLSLRASPRLRLGNAMDKWSELVIGPKQIVLGLIINTNKITDAIPYKYLKEVFGLLNSTWHPNQCCFKISEAQKLTGKVACLTEGANWAFHLHSHINSSIAYTLFKNKRLLTESSCEFCAIVEAL